MAFQASDVKFLAAFHPELMKFFTPSMAEETRLLMLFQAEEVWLVMKFQPALMMLWAVEIPELKMEEMKFQAPLMMEDMKFMEICAEVFRRFMNERNDVLMMLHTA